MTVFVLFFAGVRAIIIHKKTEASSYRSLLQESDDRIHLSIPKHSTSTQVVYLNCLIQTTQTNKTRAQYSLCK